MPGGGCALPGLEGPLTGSYLVGPVSTAPPGDDSGYGAAFMPGGGWRLTRPGGFVRPVVNIFTMVAETAGAGGLKIAETFPEGRGSPHGCGLRAVFCTDAASARPEACRDKSKEPRSGDFAGRSPGVQGAAATGRPLCAPCAIRDIAQKTYRERNLPGIDIEVVALPGAVRTRYFRLCRYYAGRRLRLTRPGGSSHRLTHRRPGKRSATGR